MKSILTLLAFVFAGFLCSAQQIKSFTLVPSNPTDRDTVVVIANMEFRNSSCALSNKGHSVNRTNRIIASAHHCQGTGQAICSISDTFNIGQLPAGNYDFDITLTSGFGGNPCTPGFVPDDRDTLSFVVQAVTGIEKLNLENIKLYPNPVDDYLFIADANRQIEQMKIISLNGSTILMVDQPKNKINLSSLATGVYYVQLMNSNEVKTHKIIKL